MGQLKISDMFSSPQSQPLSQHTTAPSSTGEARSLHKSRGERRSQSPRAELSPRKQRRDRQKAQMRARSPLSQARTNTEPLPSIPSTPVSEIPSSQAEQKQRGTEPDDRIPETPPRGNKRAASTITPNKVAPSTQGTSPFNPFNISSGSESSDSDCKIEKVLPSPNRKRKLPETNRQDQSGKKAKAEQAGAPRHPGLASVKASVLAPKHERLPSKRNPMRRGNPASNSARATPTSQPSSSASNPTAKSALTIKAKTTPKPNDDSDCFIEKVQVSPKKRLQDLQQQANVKRRRVGDAKGASAFVAPDNNPEDGQECSDCELVKIVPSPRKLASKVPVGSDSDADDEATESKDTSSRARRKMAIPRKMVMPKKTQASFSKAENDHSAVVEPAATPTPSSTQAEQSPFIDLSQLSTSEESDFSDEMPDRQAQASQLPAQIVPSPQGDDITGVQGASSQTPAVELASPSHGLIPAQDEPVPQSDNLDSLMAYLDQAQPLVAKREPSPDSSDNELFSTAREYPYDDGDIVQVKLESQEDATPIKQEGSAESASSIDDEAGVEELSSDEMPGLRNIPDICDEDMLQLTHGCILGDEDLIDAGSRNGAGSGSESPISYQSSSGSEEYTSSPPATYQLPLADDDTSRPIKAEPDSESNDETGSEEYSDNDLPRRNIKAEHAGSVANLEEHPATPSPYKLQPVYSGGKLKTENSPGTPATFQPRHRESLVGLKGILKAPKTWPGHESDEETEYSPFPGISPFLKEQIVSSPSERIQHGKDQAKAIRASAQKTRGRELAIVPESSTPAGMSNKRKTLADLRSRSWLPPCPNILKRSAIPAPKQSQGWIQQKKRMTPLAPIPDASSSESDESESNSDSNSDSSEETPSKPPTKRRSPAKQQSKTNERDQASDDEQSEGELKKRLEERQLEPITNSNWVKPPQEVKPSVVRDGVSEHAIKPTVARFEKKTAAGKGFKHTNSDGSSRRYSWDVDWSMPPAQTERTSRAVAAELEHRGIKTDRQYGNFWYNLTMKYSKLAGSHVPLFTAKKKALDDFVEEAMKNDELRRHRGYIKAQKRKEEEEKKKNPKLPEGVEAFQLWGAGETDDESKSEDSDSDGEDLVAKMQADMEKHRKSSGGGTSCGRRKK
ncbi:hypothetical protein FZEAL_2041 [Fusarium zealandicum]|uniref:Uncharacterized protein n=1 Tax=Fusarium zealandicum TaxID=1053134 RepID=A0A8H4URN3_9HYPO|nr:hypothetical protein FZEAL_2041 [Fusarium zealandicum]